LSALNELLPSSAFIPLCTVNDRASCVVRIAAEVSLFCVVNRALVYSKQGCFHKFE